MLEGVNNLDLDESGSLDIKETEGDGEEVDEKLPDTATAILQEVTRNLNKRKMPPTPSKTHKHQDTRAKLDEPIEKLFIRITRPPRTS